MKNKIIRTFLTAILVHILLAITLYYTLGWTDELPDELTARPTLVLLGTFASAVLWFNNFRVLFYVIDVSDRKSIDCKIILGSLGKMNTIVRKSFAIVLAICILLPSFIATAIAADVTDGFSQKASDSGYFCVDDLIKSSTDFLIILAPLRKCRNCLEYQAFPAFCVSEDTPHIMAYRSLIWRSKVVKP